MCLEQEWETPISVALEEVHPVGQHNLPGSLHGATVDYDFRNGVATHERQLLRAFLSCARLTVGKVVLSNRGTGRNCSTSHHHPQGLETVVRVLRSGTHSILSIGKILRSMVLTASCIMATDSLSTGRMSPCGQNITSPGDAKEGSPSTGC